MTAQLFAAIGGSGSTYLIRRLGQRFTVGNKPDTVYRSRLSALSLGALNAEQGALQDRAPGFAVDDTEDLQSMIRRYVAFVREDPGRVAVFNTAAELGVFSQLGVTGLVFLIRHPVHAYGSWAKAERHGNIVQALGGIETVRPATIYAERWCRFTDELLRLQQRSLLGGVVRYEFAKQDAAALDRITQWAFAGFDSTRRNYWLPSNIQEHVRSVTEENVRALYGAWSLDE